MSLKKSVLQQRIKSKWQDSSCQEERERNIADMLVKYDKSVHPVGEGLSEAVRV